jgi:hypothetical protein
MPVSGLQIVEAARHEMALTLEDVILRRTSLGSAGYPGDEAVTRVETLMREEVGWSTARAADEVQQLKEFYCRSGFEGLADDGHADNQTEGRRSLGEAGQRPRVESRAAPTIAGGDPHFAERLRADRRYIREPHLLRRHFADHVPLFRQRSRQRQATHEGVVLDSANQRVAQDPRPALPVTRHDPNVFPPRMLK